MMQYSSTNNSACQKACKWCHNALQEGRPSRLYCSDACKQAAYYYRKKSCRNRGDAHRDSDVIVRPVSAASSNANNVTRHEAISVTKGEPDSVTKPDESANRAGLRTPQSDFNDQSNSYFTMEHNPSAAGAAVTQTVQSTGQAINVMGMNIDRQFITGLLDSVPQAEQRELSSMLLKTVLELFPDLSDALHQGPQGQDSYPGNPDEEESDAYDDRDAGEDQHYGQEQDDEEEESEDSDAEYGNSDDDEDEQYEDEDEHDHNQYNGETINAREENYPASSNKLSYETGRDAGNGPVTGRSAEQTPVFRLGEDAYDTQPISHSQTYERDGHLPHENGIGQEHAGSYLNRFTSPRIRRGMNVWEELLVTVPDFMEGYLTRYAADHLIDAQPNGRGAGKLVTFHILFHRAHHRRPVCRLLDLVLEAEEGLLSEADFRPGGAFHTRPGNNQRMSAGPEQQGYSHSGGYEQGAGEANWEEEEISGGDDYSPVDYDCYGDDVHNAGYNQNVGRQYVSAQEVAACQRGSVILKIMGIDTGTGT